MQASTSLTPQTARKIALRQGLLFGTFAGCFALLSTAFTGFIPVSLYSFNLIYILAFIAFFVAGYRTAKQTNRIDMGALAGFWAGVAVAILGLLSLLMLAFIEYPHRGISLASIVYAFSDITPVLLALLAGVGIGTLGGFIGKIYAETSVPQPSASVQPIQPSADQPTQSSTTQQHQV